MVGEMVAFFVSDLSQDGNGSVVRSSAESAEASAVRVLCKCCSEISHKMTSLGCFFVSGGSFPLTFTDVETRKGTKGDKEKSVKWRFYAKIGDFECRCLIKMKRIKENFYITPLFLKIQKIFYEKKHSCFNVAWTCMCFLCRGV
jgi:hypothetical protein